MLIILLKRFKPNILANSRSIYAVKNLYQDMEERFAESREDMKLLSEDTNKRFVYTRWLIGLASLWLVFCSINFSSSRPLKASVLPFRFAIR